MMTTMNGYEACNLKAMEDYALAHLTEEASMIIGKMTKLQKEISSIILDIADKMERGYLSHVNVSSYSEKIAEAYDKYHRLEYFDMYTITFWISIKVRFGLFEKTGKTILDTMTQDLKPSIESIEAQVGEVEKRLLSTFKAAVEAIHDASGMLQKKEKEEA